MGVVEVRQRFLNAVPLLIFDVVGDASADNKHDEEQTTGKGASSLGSSGSWAHFFPP